MCILLYTLLNLILSNENRKHNRFTLIMYQNDIKKRVDLVEIILTFTCLNNRTNSPRAMQ